MINGGRRNLLPVVTTIGGEMFPFKDPLLEWCYPYHPSGIPCFLELPQAGFRSHLNLLIIFTLYSVILIFFHCIRNECVAGGVTDI